MARSEFLAYGGHPRSDGLDLDGTKDFLEGLGFGYGELRQARDAIASHRSGELVFEPLGENFCDFCYVNLMGGEYDELKDGRQRCSRCSRSVVTTHAQFVDEFHRVRRNMEAAFGISITVPVVVKMVNAKEIAKQAGTTFTPTGDVDARVLGLAKKGDIGCQLYIENGAPRMAAVSTMAHELTHIWQYANWEISTIASQYGAKNVATVYEGMAMWAEVQYLLYIRDIERAQREYTYTLQREDIYGDGFKIFLERYPLRIDGDARGDSPFNEARPL